jgi:hypothetical protein
MRNFESQPISWDGEGTSKTCKPNPITLGPGNKYALPTKSTMGNSREENYRQKSKPHE